MHVNPLQKGIDKNAILDLTGTSAAQLLFISQICSNVCTGKLASFEINKSGGNVDENNTEKSNK